MSFRLTLALLAVSVPGCGDILSYPLRHGASAPAEPSPGANGSDNTGSVPAPDAGLHLLADGGGAPDPDPSTGSPPPCRWPTSAELGSFCSGETPKAATNFEPLALQAVRAVGPVPRFHFVLVDTPTQLVVDLMAPDTAAQLPTAGRHNVSRNAEQWQTRVYSTTCDLDLNCAGAKDWLSEPTGDLLLGWVELRDSRAGLCLAAIRGSKHTLTDLPCSVLLYTPAIPVQTK